MTKLYKVIMILASLSIISACKGNQSKSNDVNFSGSREYTADMLEAEGYVRDDKFAMNLREGDRVLFAYDSAELTSSAQNILKAHATFIKANPNVKVVIEGHADERGTAEYNLALGENRAKAVRNYLISLGVDSSRASTISYGESRPDVAKSNEEAWSKNRRAVTVVYKK